MNKFDFYTQLLNAENKFNSVDYIINAIILVGLILLLGFTYRKCGNNISDRKQFSANFLLLGLTTMLIIIVVKTSIILSLGLVGALSIIRFRAAIKDPEELVYVFFVIALGLGLGANLRYITISAGVIIISIQWIKFFFTKNTNISNLLITVSGDSNNNYVPNISDIISKYNRTYKLKRLDEDDKIFEISYHIETFNVNSLDACKKEIMLLDKNIKVSIVDFTN